MKAEILLFVSQFALVFLLGFQSQCVRDDRRSYAAAGSFLLGCAQAFQWKVMPNATPLQISVWLCAGPIAIVTSMWAHKRHFKKRR